VKKRISLPTLAVTGGTGFVGGHLLRLARERGHPVRALTRAWRPPEEGVEWVEGTLDRAETLERLCEGADVVVHIAGMINGPDRAAFEQVNAGGTAAMVDAARAAGVRRFIHISSLSAREPELSNYGWSKSKSERIVAASGLNWTVMSPPAIFGPGDRETLELFKMARRGLGALPPRGRFSVIHVDDLCRLILDVIPAEDSWSETYEPDDGTADGWEHRHFARTLGRTFDKRAATLSMPRAILHAAAGIDRLLRGSKAKLTRDRVRYFCHPDWVASDERRPPPSIWAPQVRTPTGLRETANWYREQRWIR